MSNGCGCQKGVLKYIRPPYARTFYAACCLHDNDYDWGGDSADRREADIALYRHMVRIAAAGDRTPLRVTWLTAVALLYYISVRIFGRFYFNYKKG